MRLQHDLSFILARDTALTELLTERKVRTDATDEFNIGDSAIYRVPANSQIDVPLSDAYHPVGFLFVKSYQDVYLKINTVTEINLVPRASADDSGETIPGLLLLMAQGINFLTIRNDEDTEAVVQVAWAAKDESATTPPPFTSIPLAVSDDDAAVVAILNRINFRQYVSATDRGTGVVDVDVDLSSRNLAIDIQDDGVPVTHSPSVINFSTGLVASVDGFGNVTIEALSVSVLTGLSDVDALGATEGQILVYREATGLWTKSVMPEVTPQYTSLTLPPADVTQLRKFAYVKDPGAAGELRFCREAADGSYEWTVVAF